MFGQPVTPAKQLCVGSEHSSRDPPGQGSHTRLALEELTPHCVWGTRSKEETEKERNGN